MSYFAYVGFQSISFVECRVFLELIQDQHGPSLIDHSMSSGDIEDHVVLIWVSLESSFEVGDGFQDLAVLWVLAQIVDAVWTFVIDLEAFHGTFEFSAVYIDSWEVIVKRHYVAGLPLLLVDLIVDACAKAD